MADNLQNGGVIMTQEAKHTRGPWKEKHGAIYGGGIKYKLAVVHMGGRGSDEYHANARLIAVAPDLLEALQKSAEGWNNALELGLIPERHRPTAVGLREEALAAIAKATQP